MTLFVLLFSIIFGIGSLAFGYYLAGIMIFVRWILFVGALWLIAALQRWRWFAYFGLAFTLSFALLGLWFLNFSPGWMFAGAIGGLAAFNLTFFWNRVRLIESDEGRRGFESPHLRRISFLIMLGMILSSLTMLVKKQFSIEWGIVLVVMIALGLTQFFASSRKGNR